MSTSDYIVIVSQGDLISTNVKDYRDRIDSVLLECETARKAAPLLELDLRAARFIDSVGINLLVLTIRRAKELGGSVRLQIANPNVNRVLTFMRVNQHAEIVFEKGAS